MVKQSCEELLSSCSLLSCWFYFSVRNNYTANKNVQSISERARIYFGDVQYLPGCHGWLIFHFFAGQIHRIDDFFSWKCHKTLPARFEFVGFDEDWFYFTRWVKKAKTLRHDDMQANAYQEMPPTPPCRCTHRYSDCFVICRQTVWQHENSLGEGMTWYLWFSEQPALTKEIFSCSQMLRYTCQKLITCRPAYMTHVSGSYICSTVTFCAQSGARHRKW